MTVITPIVPAATRLDGNLRSGEEALARARRAGMLAPTATVITRVSVYVATPEEVEALADDWHVKAWWAMSGRKYSAMVSDGIGETEAVYVRQEAADEGAAA